MINHKENQ